MAQEKKIVRTEDGKSYIVGDKLGKGGQGIVYKVICEQDKKPYALKLYLDDIKPAFLNNLRRNIQNGAPNDSFCWPKALTEPVGPKKRYGYIMDLFPREYTEFIPIVKGKKSFPSKEIQIAALIELVEAFEKLHASGYSYQDLNDGGVMFNLNNGKVLIADNDNVAGFGENLGIMGKFKFMAPEVAIGMFLPDKHSDRFSLAVLLFYLLVHAHPYDGCKRFSTNGSPMTNDLKQRIYGSEAVFIFDPNNKSNRPDPEADKLALSQWPLLPDFIQELFIKTFTTGMPYPGATVQDLEVARQGRTTEKEWKEALYRYLDTMVECPKCGVALCAKVDENDKIVTNRCPHCGKPISLVLPVLSILRRNKKVRSIVLDDKKVISKTAVTTEKSSDPAFEIIRSKKNPNVYGIKNLLEYKWVGTQPGQQPRLIQTGDILPALDEVEIEFDYVFKGKIVYGRH